ncbi:hypothetical protein BE08_30880 [Sorangium cellulosum]|uniref:Uncharacterized protein n=1 Tax=Sorangium cellulosum TaxID=56 RepID=A0A150P7N3_SORCE|nr:hypothetical protein BE08_30880 [Sorangium cellulosum]
MQALAHERSPLHDGSAMHAFMSAAHRANRHVSQADSGARDGHCTLQRSDAQPPSRKRSEMPSSWTVKHVCSQILSPASQIRRQLARAAHSGFSWHAQ